MKLPYMELKLSAERKYVNAIIAERTSRETSFAYFLSFHGKCYFPWSNKKAKHARQLCIISLWCYMPLYGQNVTINELHSSTCQKITQLIQLSDEQL